MVLDGRCTCEDTFNENSNRIQGSNHPQASSQGSQLCNLQFSLGKEAFWCWAGLSECYSGAGGSKPQDESRCAPPDPRDEGFLQKIVDFLGGGKIGGK